jgi:sucrose phosphorylase
VSGDDLKALDRLGISLKFDLVLNHLSVGSPQFKDLLKNGDNSLFKDFFIDWNEFWKGEGEMCPDGYMIPKEEHLRKLFMRKPGLPILKVRFPDGSERPYWNTFYQQIDYHPVTTEEIKRIISPTGNTDEAVAAIVTLVNEAISKKSDLRSSLSKLEEEVVNGFSLAELIQPDDIVNLVESKRSYLGQMDLNADSEKVWQFYEETFKKLRQYGGKLIRLDAFA